MATILAFALDLEDAQLAAQPWYAAFLDDQKYFDTIAWEALWPLAEHCPPRHDPLLRCLLPRALLPFQGGGTSWPSLYAE